LEKASRSGGFRTADKNGLWKERLLGFAAVNKPEMNRLHPIFNSAF